MFATTTRTAAALLLAIVATLTVAVDSAAAHDASVSVPVESADSTYVVQVNAGPETWQIRRSARELNAQLAEVLPQLQIRTSGDCSTADACVTVVADWFTDAEMVAVSPSTRPTWGGLATYPTASERTVYLNTATTFRGKGRHIIARHELGHVLGLGHHYGPGIMGEHANPGPLLSDSEIEVLRSLYAPRA